MRDSALGVVVCCAVLLTNASTAQKHNPERHWDYGSAVGPSHWGELSPDCRTCSTGHSQSPIDIRNTNTADLPEIVSAYLPLALTNCR